MSRSARDRAERCFALARSTTFEGERANAIAQGTRIAEAAGLSLDDFDIPGRVRQRRRQPGEGVRYHSYAGFASEAAFAEALKAAIEALRAQSHTFYYAEPRPPRYCPHGSDMALFGESCVLCERERRAAGAASGGRKCPGGCGKTILFGNSCTDCARRGFA